MAHFKIEHEVTKTSDKEKKCWKLYFQKGEYIYNDGKCEKGYRFILRRPDGSLQAARGQARIPSKNELIELLELASKEGWFNDEE